MLWFYSAISKVPFTQTERPGSILRPESGDVHDFPDRNLLYLFESRLVR
jgi:hypothetical protein